MPETSPKLDESTTITADVREKLGFDMTDLSEETVEEDKPVTVGSKIKGVGGKPPRNTKLKGQLTQFYGSIGLLTYPFDQVCGKEIVQNAEIMAESLDQLAQQNPKVKAVLEKLVQTGAWSGVIAAHAPVLIMLARHHVPAVDDMITRRMEPASVA